MVDRFVQIYPSVFHCTQVGVRVLNSQDRLRHPAQVTLVCIIDAALNPPSELIALWRKLLSGSLVRPMMNLIELMVLYKYLGHLPRPVDVDPLTENLSLWLKTNRLALCHDLSLHELGFLIPAYPLVHEVAVASTTS